MGRSCWQPTQFLRWEKAFGTSMQTVRIVTDAGPAYIKAMGNRQGEHCLACEWVGTQLADWFGLPTFDYVLMQIDASVDEIPFHGGGNAASGPAFVTKAVEGNTWSGDAADLQSLVNPEAVSQLIVFDTWTRNCDRCHWDPAARHPNFDNVFLERIAKKKQSRLIAMDHSSCFTCNRNLTAKVAEISHCKDSGLYGLFPGFIPHVRQRAVEDAIARLRDVRLDKIEGIVDSIPPEWDVSTAARRALKELIVGRAAFVAETILESIRRKCWPDQLFDNR